MVNQARDSGGGTVANTFIPGTASNVDGTSGSQQSGAMSKDTVLRLMCNSATNGDCYYKVGTNPTASTSDSTMLFHKQGEQVLVPSGQKIAAVRGILNITECD